MSERKRWTRKKWGFSETKHCARRKVGSFVDPRKVENKRDNFDMG